ncbi:ABC transporter, transmembrane region [Rhodospirillum rubrum ATCC 11170]|uniref:ABC transporter, transmembrane region n=1 Tax=Rhodospirillum rubrum (strain ATCC 11170 / ATH 1.1.1 / DSM 467 / LMG 4362 / NCIMB 8255 / S1) TaxID=269796 RepID=Q2RW31_RHORT|nr:ABC transporter, transmembrane region [Rhodospirillum rubrum ATCC 11170]MBK5953215.1 ABC transporter ATP-binding protein [Rhodospirillum rubrum]HAQ00410.1 ABC transporter ATP-binding protein [Rhodospirillum rubrum]HCF17348.1 ABC transporter ATP-binding protein [Rhodospirillum rubrum]
MNRVIATSGRPKGALWRGLGLRVLERIFAITPFFLGSLWLADAVSGREPALSLPLLGMCLAALLAGQMLCSYLGQMACFLGAYDLMIGYREQVIDHIGRLPLGVLQKRRIGHLAAIVTDDVKRVEEIFTHVAIDLVAAASAPLLFLAVLTWVDWRLSLALMVTLPMAIIGLNAARGFFLARGRTKQTLVQETSGLIVEFVTGLKTLRLFNQTAPWLDRLDRRFAALREISLGVEAWGGGSIQLYRLCLEGGLVSLLLTAGWLANRGALDPLAWVLFALVAGKLLEPLLDAAAFLTELRLMVLAEGRIAALRAEPLLPEGTATLAAAGEVAFQNVSFRYDDAWVLRDVSFRVGAGTMTAIVGPSGSGKTTLLHLLARFFDPQAGAVTIAGRDIRTLDTQDLYRHLGFVFQDVQLFDGTLLENLLIGRPGADEAAVAAACTAAYCDPFLARLPDGLASRIGENGQRLSGGERQRLSIARAILKDAPILLLDEATASVDPAAQYEIQRALSHLAQGRTVIMVAHRLHTIRHADQILVLDQGRILEQGRHDDLLAQAGLYAALWREQSR